MNTMELERLFNIGIALSANADSDSLMREIVDVAMELTHCDGGTLYILEEGELHFYIMVTISLGIDRGGHGQKIELPPVQVSNPQNVCARAAAEKRLINVAEVYKDDRFDFSGPQRYDSMTGYRTKSMLVIPMLDDKGDVIGVLQLLNAKDDRGCSVAFPEECEQVIQSLASQAAIRLTNLNYSREITKVLESIVQVLSTAIDARTPYNANHTRNMAKYGERFLNWLREEQKEWFLNPEEQREFLMAVWLHDIGKLVTPLTVMDKPSRLAGGEKDIRQRFEIIGLLAEIEYLKGELAKEEYDRLHDELEEAWNTVLLANQAGYLQEDVLKRIEELAARTYIDREGRTGTWLNAEETEALCVRKGTLTAAERQIMENHVVMTKKLLEQVHFSKEYSHVTRWASNHHEYLDGTGYPNKLTAAELSAPERLLTILDIYDALTAKDRPYKKPMPEEKAFEILRGMAGEGKLDAGLLELFFQSEAWSDEAFSARARSAE